MLSALLEISSGKGGHQALSTLDSSACTHTDVMVNVRANQQPGTSKLGLRHIYGGVIGRSTNQTVTYWDGVAASGNLQQNDGITGKTCRSCQHTHVMETHHMETLGTRNGSQRHEDSQGRRGTAAPRTIRGTHNIH